MSLRSTKKASNEELYKHCFTQLMELNAGLKSPDEIKAAADMVKQMNVMQVYEINYAKTVAKGINPKRLEENLT